MSRARLASIALVTSLIASPASGAVIAFFNDGGYVDVAEEAANLRTSLVNLGGNTITDFTGTTNADFTTALAGVDTLVIPELQNGDLYAGLDADARTTVTNFVRDGGDLIITSQVTRASALINGLFGKSVTSGSSGVSALNADDALGTSFEGGPATLPDSNAVQSVATSSLPSFALSIYEVGASTTLFVFPEDAGSVIYLGFDWFEDTPIPADWETALGLALDFESNVWDGSDDGNWSTAANWTTNSAPGANERVVFAGSANTTVNHDNPASTAYAAITFASDAAAFTITGNTIGLTDGANVTNRSSNTQTFDADLELSNAAATVTADTAGFDFNGDIALGGTSNLTITGDEDTSIDGAISGSGSLTKAGAGDLTLTAANTYTGGTTVSAGTLIGNVTSLQGDITNNATLRFSQVADGTYADVISGTGAVTKTGAGVLTLSGANTYTGGTTVSAGTLTGNATSLQGDIANSAAVVFNQTTDGSYGDVISGAGSVTKSGAGDLTLSGANTYTGGTTVSAGTLIGNATSLQGDITNNAALRFSQVADGTYADVISGSGALVKTGAGVLTLSGANTYTGGTTVSAGTLAGDTTGLQGDITNNATLQFAMGGDGTFSDVISGAGAVTKTGAGDLTLSGANTYTGGTTVSAGTLIGDVTSLRGDITNNATLEFSMADTGTYSDVVSGTGDLNKTGAGSLTLSGANTFSGTLTVSAGTLILGNNTAAGSGDTAVTGGILRGAATIGNDLDVTGGVLEPGNSIGAMTVTGAFTLDGGTWQVEIDDDGNADLVIADSATLTSGTVQAAPTERIIENRTYTILQTTSGIAGDPGDLTLDITNDSYLIDFTLEIDGNDLLLNAQGAGLVIVDAVEPLDEPNLHDTAVILDTALAEGTGGDRVAELRSYTQAQLQTVVRQLQPQARQAGNLLLRHQQRTIYASLQERQRLMQVAVRRADKTRRRYALADAAADSPAVNSAIQAADEAQPLDRWTPWARSLNDWGDLDGDSFASGYDWRSHGIDVGAERLINDRDLVGFSFAALWSDISGKRGSGAGEVVTVYGNLYASRITPDWRLDGGLSYGHAWTDTMRPVTPPGVVAKGDYDSNIYSAFVGGGKVFQVGNWDVEPFSTLTYTHVRDGGYAEAGAGAFNSTVAPTSTNSLRHALGVRLSRDFELDNGTTLSPRLSAAWEHEYLDDQVVTRVDLLGGTFTSRSIEVGRDTARLTAGLDWRTGGRMTLFADLTASINEDWNSTSASVGLRWSF